MSSILQQELLMLEAIKRYGNRFNGRHREPPPLLAAIGSGLAGAVALTLVHETARRVIPHAPRVDVIGVRALSRPIRAAGYQPPHYNRLHNAALAGELVSNGAYYSLVGAGDRTHAWQRGAVLGLIGGLGAVLLPPVLGLGQQPHRKTPWTQVMTVAWYVLGGLAAAATYQAVARED
jgi:hypothetical protein